MSPAYDAETDQVPSSPDAAAYETEQEAMASGPLKVQVVSKASPGSPFKVTRPVIDCESPLSSEVTVTVQVVIPPFQSIEDGLQLTLVEVPVAITKLEDDGVELDP